MTAPTSVGFPRAYVVDDRSESLATGVGNIATAVVSDGPPSRKALSPAPPRFEVDLLAVGVGKMSEDPDPFSEMRTVEIVRSQHTPFRIAPQRGHVSENDSEPSNSEIWGVFHEHESRSNFANDPSELSPEPGAGSADARSATGAADVLAREPSRHHINTASPCSTVKGSYVIPDRERGQQPIVLSGHQYTSGVGLGLDGADGSPAEQLPAEDASTNACEKCQLTHVAPWMRALTRRMRRKLR